MKLPIVAEFRPEPTDSQLRQTANTAQAILAENPQLAKSANSFRRLIVDQPIGDDPTLHLDDFSEIPVIGKADNSKDLQQRCRLRAGQDDWVIQPRPIEPGFSEYCENKLGLGKVTWLYPELKQGKSRHIALACWRDRQVRQELMQAMRHHGLRYLHPHLSTLHVWELAALLASSARRPFQLIGPPPALARWANDKIEFARAVARLLGESRVPQTESAYNFATLSEKVLDLAKSNLRIGIKFPYGTGGCGNFQIDALQIRPMHLRQVRDHLKCLLQDYQWPRGGRLLIDVWETEVLANCSVQTWIPPSGHGEPVVEGIYRQLIFGEKGHFCGSQRMTLPEHLSESVPLESLLVATLFQRLGYVGRCSLDFILVGQNLEDCRVEYIECNARWGGTSTPMTLVNRIVTERSAKYSSRLLSLPGLNRISFAQLLEHLDSELFDPRTGEGHFVFFDPARLQSLSAIEAIAISTDQRTADELLTQALPRYLAAVLSVPLDQIPRPENYTVEQFTRGNVSPADNQN